MSNFTPEFSLPTGGIPATGIFTAVQNIVDNTFESKTGQTDPPYNQTLIGDSSDNVVGSFNNPYLPMALPAYIPTIYQNIYDVQTNLKDRIPIEDMSSNRLYPTSYAVKQYVQLQLFGSETLVPNSGADTLIVATGLTTTALVANDENTGNNVDVYLNYKDSSSNLYVTHFGINEIPSTRQGATKNIICLTELGNQYDASGNFKNEIYSMQIDLTVPVTDPVTVQNAYFLVAGTQYLIYRFAAKGDGVTMLQFKENGVDYFYVTNYGGVFSQI